MRPVRLPRRGGYGERFSGRTTGPSYSGGLGRLATVTEADLDRTARHSDLGVVTMREMLNEWAAHDLMHTVQGERALMQPFIVGSGKWRSYFTDHDAVPAAG